MSGAINPALVNYLRWGALAYGVYYGWGKQKELTAFAKTRAEAEKRKEYELLIEEANIAYQAQKDRELAQAVAPLIIDPESYRFAPEDWVAYAEKQFGEQEKSAAKPAKKK
ncbi:hypothetical protein DFJ74DRAFT_661024 [Hyaloraphidium curvatum]|nr:hypothetical protein DFJ74DRAFT_661024 [Hyaloraphidium curvatum]